jgi:hypothetical protein
MNGITLDKKDMTPGQEKQFIRVIMDELEKSGHKNKAGVGRILARGDQLKAIVGPAFVRLGAEVTLVDSALLEPITIVSVPGIEGFSAKEKFTIGTQDGVVIGWLGDNFKKYFLSGVGKSEIDVPKQELRIHKLRKGSVDGPIIKELSGEELVETNLATMWELMKKQGVGQAGDLLVNGYANIFYIPDTEGNVWAVSCSWSAVRGWGVEADPIADPSDWRPGYRVFSR